MKDTPEDMIEPGKYTVSNSRQYKVVQRRWKLAPLKAQPDLIRYKAKGSKYTIEERGKGSRPWRVCLDGAVVCQGKGNASPFHCYLNAAMAAWAVDHHELGAAPKD